MRGLLSPTSRINCPNYFPSSPSNKSVFSSSMEDSFNSLNYSQLLQSQAGSGRHLAFKKIKQDRIKQKNEQGKIIKQMVYKNNNKRQRLKTLDEVKTIQSRNSSRSSISVGKRIIQQSIIIMSGKDVQRINKQQQQRRKMKNEPETPCFKRRNTFNQQSNLKTDFLKPISINPALVKSIETGLLYHYQIVKKSPQYFSQLLKIKHQGILQIYTAIPIKSCFCDISMVVYQPYSQTLSQHLLCTPQIPFKKLLSFMTQLLKTLSFLHSICIHPQIQPTSIVLVNDQLKLKLRINEQEYDKQSSQREIIRQCGYYFGSLVRSYSTWVMTPRARRRTILGMGIGERMRFESLMNQLISIDGYTLDQAYLKLSTFQ